MKIFVISFVLISIIYGSVGHCIRGPSGDVIDLKQWITCGTDNL